MDKITARERAKALVAQMTPEEKMSQLLFNSPAIERLGINAYNWWNEGSHGVARAGTATVFPHAIAMAATFNPELVNEVADVISTEGRIKYTSMWLTAILIFSRASLSGLPILISYVTQDGVAVRKHLVKTRSLLLFSVKPLLKVFKATENL